MKKSHVFILFAAILLCAAIPFLISAQADAVVGYAQVEKVRLNIEEPYGYREALFSGEILGSTSYGIWDFTGEDHGVNFYNGVSWYDETGKRSLTPGETFKTGRIYTLRVYFEIIASQTEFHSVKLANSVTVVQKIDRYLNGETVEDCYPTGKSIYRYAGLTRTFEACPAPPAEIRSVNIVDLDTPFDLADPDFSATAEGPNYIVDTIHSIQPFSYTNGICWVQQLGNGYTYSLDKGSDVFGRGKIYTVRILVQAEYPYRFLISSDKTKPDISAYIKGYRCEVEAANGYDPYYYAILKYTFPACPYGLTRIETANVKDVQIPKAGVTPDYEVTPDVGMTVLDDEGTVIKNGICWYDYTAGAFLKPTDTFIKGHEYSISMCLKTAEGYLFRDDEDGNCLTKASANGGLAQAECDMGSAPNDVEKTVMSTSTQLLARQLEA